MPTVLVIAAVTFAVWFALGPEPRLTYALVSSITVLVIACPVRDGTRHPDRDHGRDRPRAPGRAS